MQRLDNICHARQLCSGSAATPLALYYAPNGLQWRSFSLCLYFDGSTSGPRHSHQFNALAAFPFYNTGVGKVRQYGPTRTYFNLPPVDNSLRGPRPGCRRGRHGSRR